MQTRPSRSTNPPRPAQSVTRSASAAALALATLLAATAAPAQTQVRTLAGDGLTGGTNDAPVAVIVQVPKPWYAPRFVIVGRMRETIPQYRALPGLVFKAYALAQADGRYGGVYLWKDLASARAWFSPAWFARVEHERGAAAEVRYFQVLASIDNTPGGTPADADSAAVATLSTWPMPPGVERGLLARQSRQRLEADRAIPGLLMRHAVITDQGREGQISLWRDMATARQWFNGRQAGSVDEAATEWFDTPILLPGNLPAGTPQPANL